MLVISESGSAEVWDPAIGTSTPTGPLAVGEWGGLFTATRLLDGRVLVIGGAATIWASPPPRGQIRTGMRVAIDPAEIWDPATGAFLPAGGLARLEHTATLLADGRVLIVGGYGDDSTTAEVFQLR